MFLNGKPYILNITNYGWSLVEENELKKYIAELIWETIKEEFKDPVYGICRPSIEEVLNGYTEPELYASKDCEMYANEVLTEVRTRLAREGWL